MNGSITTAALKQLSFKGMRDHVANALRRAIFDGVFKPGDLLQDTLVAQKLTVSRGSVREAPIQLEKESLVRNVHNRGWFVIELTAAEVSEIFSLRCLQQVVSLKLAASRATAAELKQLAAMHTQLRRLTRDGNLVEVLRQGFGFHRYIWSLSGHRLLEETLNKIATPYFAFIQTVIRSLSLPLKEYKSTLKTHQLIVNYIARRTRLTAEACITAHLEPLRIKHWNQLMNVAKK